MIQQIDAFLKNIGYQIIPSNLPEFTIYFQMENSFVNVVHLIDYKKELYIGSDQYEHIKQKINRLFLDRGLTEVHILSLIVGEDIEKSKKIIEEDRFAWIILPQEHKLLVYEEQAADFYGLRGKIEKWLEHAGTKESENLPPVQPVIKKRIPYATIALVSLNVLVFIICTFTGDLLYNIGGLEFSAIMQYGESYRFISSLFLHGGVQHLFNNMLLLFLVGEIVEKETGIFGFLAAYFVSGIGGGLLSLFYDVWSGQFYGSIGASGAIFGIMGVLLILVAFHQGRLEHITLPRVLFMIVYSLSVGFTSSTTDNAAHMGGFVAGVAAGIVLGLIKKIYLGRRENK